MNTANHQQPHIAEPGRLPSKYARSLAARTAPGDVIATASGDLFRVQAMLTTPDGSRFVLQAGHSTRQVSSQELARLAPLSPIATRISSLVHRVIASESDLTAYIHAAIEQAGLPLDRGMQWGSWLMKVYAPLKRYTQDQSLFEEGIREVIVTALYERRLLDPESPYAGRFDPEKLSDMPLAKKVSAFLSFLFKRRVPDAVAYVRRMNGIGMLGEKGLEPAEALYGREEDGSAQSEDKPIDSEGSAFLAEDHRDFADELLDDEDAQSFLGGFKRWVKTNQRANSAILMVFLTEAFERGLDRKETAEFLFSSDLRGRDGQPYNIETYRLAMRTWANLLRKFAALPGIDSSSTPIARAIVRAGDRLIGAKQGAHGLRIAQDDTGKIPHLPYSQTTPGTTVVEPGAAKANPNVQQQENAGGKADSPASGTGPAQSGSPQANPSQSGEEDFQTSGSGGNPVQPQQPIKRTITPEIPGQNHMQ